jgi:hypothetical protein
MMNSQVIELDVPRSPASSGPEGPSGPSGSLNVQATLSASGPP